MAHFAFYANSMLLTQLKFRAYPYHLGLLVLNDLACSMTCLPMYVLWAKNDFHNYFDKVDDDGGNSARISKRSKSGTDDV